jgi:hypothetical protein
MTDEVMMRVDNLVAELELEGYPLQVILEEIQEYLAICNELSHV